MFSILYSQIRYFRELAGISQGTLAHMAGVSLPFIQRIEYGKANPSIETTSKILRVLGLNLNIGFAAPDWSRLSYLGVPLATTGKEHDQRSSEELTREVIKCCIYLHEHPTELDRERLATKAWIGALASEYPTLFREKLDSPLVRTLLPDYRDGKLIKLQRIATETLSQYL